MYAKVQDLIGQILTKVENIDYQEIHFTSKNGNKYRLFHDQD